MSEEIEVKGSSEIVARNSDAYSLLDMPEAKFQRMQVVATMLQSGGASVNKEIAQNHSDCMAIVVKSDMWGMNPYTVMEKSHVVKGKMGHESQLISAVGHKFAPLKERLRDEYVGDWTKIDHKTSMQQSENAPGKYAIKTWSNADEDGLGIIISGTLKGESEPRKLKVKLSSCAVRNSTLWVTFPQQQIYYFAVKMWFRKYCPEAIMGMYSPDELQVIDVTPIVTVIEEPERDDMASEETIEKLDAIMRNAPPDIAAQAKASIKKQGENLTQEKAEQMIAWLYGKMPDPSADLQAQDEPEPQEPEPLLTDETRENITHFMDTPDLPNALKDRAKTLLGSDISTEAQGRTLAKDILDFIDSAE
jgi:hypothetical protein